jgi:hypothetical protein
MAAVESSIRSRPEADQKTRLDGWGRTRGGRGGRQPFIRYCRDSFHLFPLLVWGRQHHGDSLVLPTKKRSRTSQPACGDLGTRGATADDDALEPKDPTRRAEATFASSWAFRSEPRGRHSTLGPRAGSTDSISFSLFFSRFFSPNGRNSWSAMVVSTRLHLLLHQGQGEEKQACLAIRRAKRRRSSHDGFSATPWSNCYISGDGYARLVQ